MRALPVSNKKKMWGGIGSYAASEEKPEPALKEE